MRIALLATTLLSLTMPAADAHEGDHPPVRSLSTTGESEVTFEPDQATVRFTVRAVDRDADDARAEVDTAVNRMLTDLDAIIDGDDIVAQDLLLQPRYDYRDGRRSFRGYEAIRHVTARFTRLDRVGQVVQVAVVDGPISVDGVDFGLVDDTAARDAALVAAVADASHKAALIAEGLGVSLGPALEVLHSDSAAPRQYAMVETLGVASRDAPGEFRPDQLVFRSSIQVRFSLLDSE